MAFPEWVFTFIPSLPCALINFLYLTVFCRFLICSDSLETGKQFEKLNSEVRSFLPLFKQGLFPSELLLFDFCVPNLKSFVLIVNCSVSLCCSGCSSNFLSNSFC